MIVPIKSCLALTSVAGISTAVTLPLTSTYAENSGISESLAGPKIEEIVPFEHINKCVDNNGTEISFGEKSVDKVCGLVENSVGLTNSEFAEEQKYTGLFKNMGNNPRGTGSSGSEYWTTHCNKNSKGIFNNQGEGSVSLGLCEGSQSVKQGMIINNKDKTDVEICTGSCFKEGTASPYMTLDASHKEGNGRQVKFQKVN